MWNIKLTFQTSHRLMMTQDLTEVDFRAQIKDRSRCFVSPSLCGVERSRIIQRFAFTR